MWGLVDIRHGGGTTVRDVLASAGLQVLPYLLAPSGELDPKWLVDLLEVRMLLLGWTAARAAEKATEEDLARLRDLLRSLQEATTAEAMQRADFAFFEGMATSADNRVIVLLSNAVREVYMQNNMLFLGLYGSRRGTEHHEEALEAIEAGDVGRAWAAMESYGRMALEGDLA